MGTTVITSEPKVEYVDVVVIVDEALATKTADIQLVLRDNRTKTEANGYGHGAIFFFDLTPIPVSPEDVDENGDVSVTISDSPNEIGGSIIACYRLFDENGSIIYEHLQSSVFESVPLEDVPNCQGIGSG